MLSMFKSHYPWLLPLAAMLVITPFTPFLDLALSHYFYDPAHAFVDSPFRTFMYTYGVLPAQITFIAAGVLLFLSSFFKRWKRWYKSSLAIVLTLAIGAGLISHLVFKDHWGRPRPRQVIEFGGHQEFRPYYSPNLLHQPEPSKSFPCGHCTMGFFFFSLALVARRFGNRPLFWLAIAMALGLGITLSETRIAQGGHFLSDTIASALIMWLTAYACDRLIFATKENG